MNARTMTTARRGEGIEYGLYFALVFVISLVPATGRAILPRAGQPRRFPLTGAWAMAREVTPKLFQAL